MVKPSGGAAVRRTQDATTPHLPGRSFVGNATARGFTTAWAKQDEIWGKLGVIQADNKWLTGSHDQVNNNYQQVMIDLKALQEECSFFRKVYDESVLSEEIIRQCFLSCFKCDVLKNCTASDTNFIHKGNKMAHCGDVWWGAHLYNYLLGWWWQGPPSSKFHDTFASFINALETRNSLRIQKQMSTWWSSSTTSYSIPNFTLLKSVSFSLADNYNTNGLVYCDQHQDLDVHVLIDWRISTLYSVYSMVKACRMDDCHDCLVGCLGCLPVEFISLLVLIIMGIEAWSYAVQFIQFNSWISRAKAKRA